MRKLMMMAAGLLFTVAIAALAANQITASTEGNKAKCESAASCNPEECATECCIPGCCEPCN